MNLLVKPLALLIVMISFLGSAQESEIYTNDLNSYQKALTLYNNSQYKAAQTLFDAIMQGTDELSLKSDCAYYIANCAVRLNQSNADHLIMEFVETYPTSTKKNRAIMDVADYYFDKSKYPYARKWYDKVDEYSLARTDRDKFYFNYGYSLYATDSRQQAEKFLNRVKDSETYGSQAKYYLGYMAYEGNDYDTANIYFDEVGDNEKYREKLAYYQADLNFKLGKFQKAIELSLEQLPNSNTNERSELSKIIGESYFNLGNYAESIPYLKAYKGKEGKWSNTDYYQLGYAYYKQKDFDEAISEFNKIIDGNNGVAQNAYYHLGESYINLNKKQEALNAFRFASEMDYDLKIQEDAWLNYAKLSYDIGNPYQSVPQVLDAFVEMYPKSPYRDEVETLLIDSYITSKNYSEALELLKGKTSYNSKVVYQKVTFLRGVEFYNDARYQEALGMFEASINEPRDSKFLAKATFWKAETQFNLANYNDALIGFKQYYGMEGLTNLPESQNIDYNIGYTYFKLKNYKEATLYFQKFVDKSSSDELRRNDAYLRLGDGYFVSSEYNNAIEAYTQAIQINEIEPDYAAFQIAMSHGYIGQSPTKINKLIEFINSYDQSALRDDAMYELANSYVKTGETDKAIRNYERLNAVYKNSVFRSKSLLRLGLVYYNANDNNKALKHFKEVAEGFPGSGEAIQAISTIRLIYIDLGKVDEYARWVKRLDYFEISDVELDNTMYAAAEKPYLDGDSKMAIDQFNKYLVQFENGIHALKAHFYLAQLYYSDALFENALPHYTYVSEVPRNEFTAQALVRLSEINLNQSNWKEAIQVLLRLEQEADLPQNRLYAQSNLMNAYYQIENYGLARKYAETVLKTTRLNKEIDGDAKLIIARSALKTGDEVVAREAYLEVEPMVTGAVAAEAIYYNAYFKNKAGAYEASNTVIQKLVKDYSSYKKFSAMGLVVMAKNFYALDDAFQATYILESVVSNFSEFEDVVAEAKAELNNIKAEEAKTNSSITSDNN